MIDGDSGMSHRHSVRGVSQLNGLFDGKICLEEALEKGHSTLEQLAKRPIFTWLEGI